MTAPLLTSVPATGAPVLGAVSDVAEMLAAGCLVAGIVLAAIGTWQRRTVLHLVADGRRTTATAVRSVLHPADERDGHTHHVVWRFSTPDGTAYEHEGLASGVHHPQEGETATVIYDPADPHVARLETMAERTLSWALFLGTGMALLAVAVVAGAIGLLT
ncbi:MAG TPA: DUF3592 domain-containing protein [Aquihabitans sp.]|nr:DUF3592 domain-containing protein [Aquihabitans sp.]